MDLLAVKLSSMHDQDFAACREWWIDATVEDKMQIWDAIQRVPDGVVEDIVLRFAQLGFTEMSVRMSAEKTEAV